MSQITIGDKTLNFKDSVYTGDQWEQVASWVLNGGGTQIDENVEIAVKKATEAMQSAQSASASSASASDSADLSQSYAVGGTGTRDGENTDNAKYYSEQAGAVVNSLNNAHIDENGHLVYTSPGGSTVDLGEVVGSSIQSIDRTSGTGAPGTTDTYTVTLTNGDTTTFQVYNGKDGSGSGDMTKAVYDPKGKAQDIFSYADTKYSKPSGGIPKKDLASDVQASLGKADSALQNAPVTSVNSKTGAVSITKGDVGLGNVDNVKQYSASNPPPYPVTSVNGKTGAVTVSVPTIPSTTSLIKGNGSGGVSAAVKGTDYAAPSVGVSVTLRASGWNANAKTQTVSVAGVTATVNLIITAAPGSYMAYAEAGVRCTAQGAGTLTFACETVPTADVAANVLILG